MVLAHKTRLFYSYFQAQLKVLLHEVLILGRIARDRFIPDVVSLSDIMCD